MDFKYNEELTQTFMSSNQIGGFFNRLEASRKYLFGSVGVLGATNNSIIAGAFIARGSEIKPVVDVAPDWESYKYERIDLENAEQKAFFEALAFCFPNGSLGIGSCAFSVLHFSSSNVCMCHQPCRCIV